MNNTPDSPDSRRQVIREGRVCVRWVRWVRRVCLSWFIYVLPSNRDSDKGVELDVDSSDSRSPS